MNSCKFTNDDDVSVFLLDHKFSSIFASRDNHEVLFRRINTHLIKNNIIQNNIIDLGAWIGDNSIPWAKNINENNVVYAIDPSTENCDFINNTCSINKISNVKVIKIAISDKNELLSTNDGLHHCSFVYEHNNNGLVYGDYKVDRANKVDAVSLNYLYETRQIENIGYIHLDVEGMEFKVLKGCTNLIDSCRPIISFEQHLDLDDYSIILSFLNNRQYKVFLIDEILPGCRPDCRNSFAFPMEIYTDKVINDINAAIGKNIMIPK